VYNDIQMYSAGNHNNKLYHSILGLIHEAKQATVVSSKEASGLLQQVMEVKRV
jgi:hypothetical protein